MRPQFLLRNELTGEFTKHAYYGSEDLGLRRNYGGNMKHAGFALIFQCQETGALRRWGLVDDLNDVPNTYVKGVLN